MANVEAMKTETGAFWRVGCEGANAEEQGARANSIAAAYGPDLAESLLGFCQWLSKTRPGFQSAQV